MTDIVERLRGWNDLEIPRLAADEIERLRGALSEIADSDARSTAYGMMKIARQALTGREGNKP